MKTYSFNWDEIDVCMDCPLEDDGVCLFLMKTIFLVEKDKDCPLEESEVEG